MQLAGSGGWVAVRFISHTVICFSGTGVYAGNTARGLYALFPSALEFYKIYERERNNLADADYYTAFLILDLSRCI